VSCQTERSKQACFISAMLVKFHSSHPLPDYVLCVRFSANARDLVAQLPA